MNFKDSESVRAEKRFLKRYIKNEACLRRLEEKVAALDNRMTGLKAVTISDMPRGGSPISLEDLLIQKEDGQVSERDSRGDRSIRRRTRGRDLRVVLSRG